MKNYIIWVCLAVSLFITGCSATLHSTVAPGATFKELGKTFVVRFEPDNRQLHSIIADQLSLMGYPASAGEEKELTNDVDTLVTYQDKWQWDMTNYMIQINIQFRDAKSKDLIVSGESYRTSLVRKSPEEMIRETLQEILKNRK